MQVFRCGVKKEMESSTGCPVQTKGAYNLALADSLGANACGMKMYTLVMLKTGSNKIERKETTDSLFAGHMKNIGGLIEACKLVVAGPLRKNHRSFRGIFILNVKTKEEALALLESDPAFPKSYWKPSCTNGMVLQPCRCTCPIMARSKKLFTNNSIQV